MPEVCNIINRETPTKVFLGEFCKILRIPLFIENLRFFLEEQYPPQKRNTNFLSGGFFGVRSSSSQLFYCSVAVKKKKKFYRIPRKTNLTESFSVKL